MKRLLYAAGTLIFLTLRALAHGDLHEQIEAVTRQIQTNANDAALYHKRGELHRAHGEFPMALDDFAKAEKLDPKLDAVLYSRGLALSEFTKYGQAVAAFNAFLARQPGHVNGHWFRARALASLEKRAEAESDFSFVMAKTTLLSPEQIIERAGNLDRAGRGEAALAVIDEGIRRLGPIVTLQSAAIDQDLRMKRPTAALTRLDGIIEKAERKETYLVRKAEILAQNGDEKAAGQCYSLALAAIAALPESQRRSARIAQLEKDIRRKLPAPK